VIEGAVTRVMSLKDGTKKMSKSDPSEYSRINLSDTADQIYEKFKKAKTDMLEGISYDHDQRPEISNLIDIYSALSGKTIEQVVSQFEGHGFAKFKSELADLTIAYLSPIKQRYDDLIKDQSYLIKVLNEGAHAARERAAKTMVEVKELFGFLPEVN
jgi:tryptophanyl-tRNA synthetase